MAGCKHDWMFSVPCPACEKEARVTAPVTKSNDPPRSGGSAKTSAELKPKCYYCRPEPVDFADGMGIPKFLLRNPDNTFAFPTPTRVPSKLVDERPGPALANAEALAEQATKQRELLTERRRIADANRIKRDKERQQGGSDPLTGKAAWRKITGTD